MQWSKRSTSKTVAPLLGALLLAGCHAQPAPKAPQRVSADLSVLARTDPAWGGVADYDRMLARLRTSVTQARASLHPVPALSLAALSGLDLPGGAFALPRTTLAQQRLLLSQLEQAQVRRLRLRRAQARAQQLRAQMRVWQREAQAQYAQAIAQAQDQFTRLYGTAFAADSAQRLNLTLQIKALTKTVADWDLSKPPTPRLDHDRRILAAKQKQLALLNSQQTGALGALTQERLAAYARAAANSAAYVVQQRATLDQRLRALDQAAIAQQRTLLVRQTDALLSRERRLVSAAVPTAGTLGPVSLPGAAGPSPAAGLRVAEARLEAQRARWVRGVYAETRAATRDAARQRDWLVTFGPAHQGEPDRTSQLAALLASRIWRS